MKSVWNESDYRDLASRLERLTPEAPARWGKFTAPQMVCHLTDAFKMASGELRIPPRKMFLRYPVIKHLIIYVFPFPKGAPTAPQLVSRIATEWEGEVRALRRELDAFVKRGPSGPFVPHPAFGTLTRRRMSARGQHRNKSSPAPRGRGIGTGNTIATPARAATHVNVAAVGCVSSAEAQISAATGTGRPMNPSPCS